MGYLLQIIHEGEFFWLLCLAVLLSQIGRAMVQQKRTVQKWGLRIAVLASISYAIYALVDLGSPFVPEIVFILIRSLVVGGCALGLSWVWLTIFACCIAGIGSRLVGICSWIKKRQKVKKQLLQQKELSEQRKQEQIEWERLAPEREQRQKEQQEAEQKNREDQHKREAVRLSCQLIYDQHAHELQERFSGKRLAEYFDQYLSNDFPVEIVEQRGILLKEMIMSSLEKTEDNKQKYGSLNEIAAYFQKQKQEIESLQYDEQTRQTMLSSLNEQEDRTIREFLSS